MRDELARCFRHDVLARLAQQLLIASQVMLFSTVEASIAKSPTLVLKSTTGMMTPSVSAPDGALSTCSVDSASQSASDTPEASSQFRSPPSPKLAEEPETAFAPTCTYQLNGAARASAARLLWAEIGAFPTLRALLSVLFSSETAWFRKPDVVPPGGESESNGGDQEWSWRKESAAAACLRRVCSDTLPP